MRQYLHVASALFTLWLALLFFLLFLRQRLAAKLIEKVSCITCRKIRQILSKRVVRDHGLRVETARGLVVVFLADNYLFAEVALRLKCHLLAVKAKFLEELLLVAH